jgi:type IV pilus assembly protein PilQ
VVRYDMQRVSDRKLQLKLFNTQVPEFRKRPLITARFESAVDRITPVQTAQMGEDAVVVFELREPVPFEIEQEDNFIVFDLRRQPFHPSRSKQQLFLSGRKALKGKRANPQKLPVLQRPLMVQTNHKRGYAGR